MQHRQRMQYQRQQQGFLPPQAGMFPPMFIGGPGPFGAQRPQQPYYGQRPAGAPQGGRYAAVGYPPFGGNLGGARQPRPNFGGARPGQTGRGGIPQGAPRTNQRYSTQARNVQQQLGLPAPAVRIVMTDACSCQLIQYFSTGNPGWIPAACYAPCLFRA